MTFRKLIYTIHLWIGLTTGLVLSIVGLTGAIYVFAPEMEAYTYNREVEKSKLHIALSPLEIIHHYETKYGERIVTLLNQRRAARFYVLYLKNPDRKLIVNPYTGQEIADESNKRSFWDWIIQIHINLTLGKVGKYIVGSSSFLLALVLVSSGIFLWWPKNKAAIGKRFKIKWKGTRKRKIYDLHQVGGFYTHLFVGLLAITGACSTFPKLVPNLINWFTLTEQVTKQEAFSSRSGSKYQKQMSFEDVTRLSEKIHPQLHFRHIYYNQDQGDNSPIILTKANLKWISTGIYFRTYTYIDRYTGKILFQDDPREESLGQKVQAYYKRQIHYGEIGGWPTRILAFLTGLFIPVLYVTGIMIWYNRKWGKKKRGIRTFRAKTRIP